MNKNSLFGLLSGWPQIQQLVLCKYFKKNLDHTVELEMAQTRIRKINQIPHNHFLLMVSIVFAKLLIKLLNTVIFHSIEAI